MFFVIAAILILIGWYYHTYRERFAIFSKIPGPKRYPIIGNGHMFFFKSPPQILKMIEDFSAQFPKIAGLLLGPIPVVLLTDPTLVESVLGSQKLITKSMEYDFISQWLGTGLLTSTGKKWFQRRKVITPAFHFKILDQFTEIFDKHSTVMIECLKKQRGQAIDVFTPVALCALDVICETAMGVEIDAQRNSDSVYVQAVKEISGIMANRMYGTFLRIDFIFNMTKEAKRQTELLKILHGFTDSVIVSRREELMKKKGKVEEVDGDDIGVKKKMAFLDMLLQSTIEGKPLSNMDIREEVDTFMFEGHDTTSSGISFCLYLLAKHPEIQDKVFEEVRSVFGDDKKKVTTLKELNDLQYLEMVIKESLRLYPSVPMYSREVSENVDILGHIIPKGTTLITGPYFMARDPEFWKDPLKFDPERFAADAPQIHPYLHVPFSAGPRNCIGQKFAMYEMKSTISKVLRNFEVKVAPGYEPLLVAELILRPINGVMLIVNDRKY